MGPRPRRQNNRIVYYYFDHLETYPWFRLGATSKCLGLESRRLDLDQPFSLVSSPLLFSLRFTCDDSLLKLSALISSIEASTIMRAECSRTLLSVLYRCDIRHHLCWRKYLLHEVKSKLYYNAKNESAGR